MQTERHTYHLHNCYPAIINHTISHLHYFCQAESNNDISSKGVVGSVAVCNAYALRGICYGPVSVRPSVTSQCSIETDE